MRHEHTSKHQAWIKSFQDTLFPTVSLCCTLGAHKWGSFKNQRSWRASWKNPNKNFPLRNARRDRYNFQKTPHRTATKVLPQLLYRENPASWEPAPRGFPLPSRLLTTPALPGSLEATRQAGCLPDSQLGIWESWKYGQLLTKTRLDFC